MVSDWIEALTQTYCDLKVQQTEPQQWTSGRQNARRASVPCRAEVCGAEVVGSMGRAGTSWSHTNRTVMADGAEALDRAHFRNDAHDAYGR